MAKRQAVGGVRCASDDHAGTPDQPTLSPTFDKQAGYRRKSTITETEDVSYVSSAYVPQCLRYGGRPTLSNAHRAHESGVNTDNIRDELDEVITLNSVSIIVAEYIPFGANQVSTLRCKLILRLGYVG